MSTTISTTRALALHARQLAGEARQLAEHVERAKFDDCRTARVAADNLAALADLLEEVEA